MVILGRLFALMVAAAAQAPFAAWAAPATVAWRQEGPQPNLGITLMGNGITDPEKFFQCDRCSPPGKDVCRSSGCLSRCVGGRECHQTKNGGCCCDPSQMPQEGHCEPSVQHSGQNSTCLMSCCTGGSVHCGTGCCGLSNHGSAKRCGRTLQGKKQAPCCVPAEASLDEQHDKNCCIRGRGKRCDDPKHQACCLWPEAVGMANYSDPVVPCQLNCSGYRGCRGPAPFSLGWDCAGQPGRPKSQGKVRCCMSQRPSVNDPCQPRPEECQKGGRYVACPGQRGIDCATVERSICCMPGPSCCSDCKAYDEDRRQRQRHVLFAGGAAAALFLMLLAVAFRFRHRLKLWLQSRCPCLTRRRTSSTNLFIDGRGIHVTPLREPSMRFAVVCSCSQYRDPNYANLPNAARDGDGVAAEFEHLGYGVIRAQEPHGHDVFQAVCEAVRMADGRSEVLIVIYFAGHAVEVEGSLFWAGVDAVHGHQQSHISVVEVLEKLQDVHLPSSCTDFDSRNPLAKAFFVFLADCCRAPTGSSVWSLSRRREQPSRRRKADRPSFFTIFAGEPGGRVLDGRSGHLHSPFTQQLLEHMGRPLSLSDLCDQISEGLEGSGERIWYKEACGNASQHTSLAPSITPASSSESNQVSMVLGTGGSVMPESE